MDTFTYNHCVNLTSINDTVFWANNSTNTTIEVQPIVWPPFVNYNEELIKIGNTSILNYQYCGPLLFMIKTFATKLNFK
jgi:hypothetical protein